MWLSITSEKLSIEARQELIVARVMKISAPGTVDNGTNYNVSDDERT